MGFSGLGGRWVPGRGRDPGWSETLCHFNRRPTCSRIICKSHLCPAPAGLGPIRQVSQAREEVFPSQVWEPRPPQAVAFSIAHWIFCRSSGPKEAGSSSWTVLTT